MASNSQQAASGGISFTGLLTIAFVVLKLTHVIGWSWWWVFSPLLIRAGLGALFLFIALGVIALAAALKK